MSSPEETTQEETKAPEPPPNAESTRIQMAMAHIFCVIQQFCALTVYILGKKILETVDVKHLVFMRLILVVPCVFIAAILMTRRKSAFMLPKKTLLWVAASGIVGIVICQTLSFWGLSESTAANASIIGAPCMPVFTATLSIIRGTDKMTVPKGFAFFFTISGALILLKVWDFQFHGTTFGNLLIVLSSFFGALNYLIQKHILNGGHHPLVVQAYVCFTAAMVYMICYAPVGLFDKVDWALPARTWGYIVIVGVIATAFPWSIGMVALKHMSPMTTGIYVVLQPVIGGVFATITGNQLTWVQALGAVCVLIGLLCFNSSTIVTNSVNLMKRVFKSSTSFMTLDEEKDANDPKRKVINEDAGEIVGYNTDTTNDYIFAVDTEKPAGNYGNAIVTN